MPRFVSRFLADDSGATAIEYGLIVALIVLAMLTALSAFGGANSGVFNTVMGRVGDAMGGN